MVFNGREMRKADFERTYTDKDSFRKFAIVGSGYSKSEAQRNVRYKISQELSDHGCQNYVITKRHRIHSPFPHLRALLGLGSRPGRFRFRVDVLAYKPDDAQESEDVYTDSVFMDGS